MRNLAALAAAILTLASTGCRREDVREMTVAIPGLAESNKATIVAALAKYNGSELTEGDASEAASVGLDQAGEFVLYIRTEEVAETPKTFTLKADGYPEITVTIVVAAPAAE